MARLGEILSHSISGGWGEEVAFQGSRPVRIIRGAEFPRVELQRLEGAPLRYEAAGRIPQRSLEVDDIVLEISGGTKDRPTGRVVRATENLLAQSADPVIPASFCRLLRVDPAAAVPAYVYYALRDFYARGGTWEFQNRSTGLSNFQFSIFAERWTLDLPERSEQRAIAEVLGALDDKIAANDRLIVSADELLAAQFRIAAADGMDVPLSSLARFVNGKAFTKDATGTGRVVVRIAELNSGIGGSTIYNDIEVGDDHLARPGDVLFAWSGSLTVKRWFRPEAIVNQHIFKVIPNEKPMWAVKGALDQKLADFRAVAADKATTMGHIQRRHLDELVRVPSAESVGAMDELMTGLWDRALSAEIESLRLAELRDALLPALMSGRLTVKTAEAAVSQAL